MALLEQILNGIMVGTILVLLATGLSIIFGLMDVINFSHGEILALGAYFAVGIVGATGEWGFWAALILAPLLVAAVAIVIEQLTLRPLYGRNPLYHVLLTFGLVLVLNDLIAFGWGNDVRQLPIPSLLNQQVTIFGFTYPVYNYFIIMSGAVLTSLVWVFLNYTQTGLIVRAGAQDREMVKKLGIDIDRYYTLVFAAGSFAAAFGGVVIGAYQSVSLGLGNSVILPAFIVVILGGLGSFRGAIVGGLLVGIVQTLTSVYAPFLNGLVIYMLLILVLIVRPQGIFGDAINGEESNLSGISSHGVMQVLDGNRRRQLGALLVLVLLLLPFGTGALYSSYMLILMADILIFALFALSMDLVLGYTGLVSLGHALFYGVGAYTVILANIHLAPSVFVGLFIAIVITAAIAAVIGHLSIRLSGIYFAIVTLGIAQLFYNLSVKLGFTGGTNGLFSTDAVYGLPVIGGISEEISFDVLWMSFTGDTLFYYFALLIVVVAYVLVRRLVESPFGSVLKAIRESEKRARFVGYNINTYKRRSFIISGALAGLAGGLFALRSGYVTPNTLHWIHSGELIVMTIMGGIGTLVGPMIGAGIFILAEDILSSYIAQWRLVLGLIFIFIVIFIPRGLISLPTTLLGAIKNYTVGRLPDGGESDE